MSIRLKAGVSIVGSSDVLIDVLIVNTIQDGIFQGCSQIGWGQKGLPPQNLQHISYNDQTWHSYTLPKEDPKNI